MVSDDLTALAAISMGALASAAVTLALAAREPLPPPPSHRATLDVACTVPGRPVVDFAIIRADVEAMVGPDDPATGWNPPTMHLRLLRTR